jgi:2-polyprenyl-6-hydroxyphenyl methylase/3-demethylubiquinone-9 3-methyltransferase
MKKVPKYFETIGENFESWSDDYDVEQRKLLFGRLLGKIDKLNNVNPNHKVLEVGCGFGGMSELFVKLFPGLTVADVSEELARKTGSRLGLNYITADVIELSKRCESWDLILSSECIEHTKDPKKALSEMYQSLNPGGIMVISTPNAIWAPILRIGQITRLRRFNDRELFVSPKSTAALLSAMGGQVLAIDGCHFLPWQIPFIKPVLRRLDKFAYKYASITINFGIVIQKNKI